jgi:hypothetical protein
MEGKQPHQQCCCWVVFPTCAVKLTTCVIDKILISTSLDKNFITAWKSITKLVIFQSFVAKCCKMRIIWPCQVVIFSHFALRGGNWQTNTLWVCQFPVCNTKWLKNGKLRKAILSAFYNISQRNNFVMLFQAVMKFLSRLVEIKILSITQVVNCIAALSASRGKFLSCAAGFSLL